MRGSIQAAIARVRTLQTLVQSLQGLSRTLRRFRPQIGAQWRLIAGGFATMIAEIALRLLEPWPLKFIFDRIIPSVPAVGAHDPGWLDTLAPMTLLTLAALAVVVVTALRALAAYAGTVSFALAGNRVLTEVRSELYRHIQRLSLSYHSKARSGDLLTRLTGDIGRLQEVTVTALMPLLINVLTLVGMVLVMLWLNWQLALLALSVFPLFMLSMTRLTGRIQRVARKQRQREGALAATAAEAIGAIRVVQALSLESTLERAFASQNQQSLAEGVKGKRLSANLERTTDVVVAVGTALVLWYGARLAISGALTPGDLLVFITYLKNAFKPMRDLAKYTGRIAKAAASGERIIDILNTQPDIRDRPGAQPAPPLRGEVHFAGVSFAYESGPPVLRDLNLVVRPGTRVALVGPSGSGKSTLVSLLPRLYDPTDGMILIDRRDIRNYTLESLRKQIGIVLQESVLFAVSVRDNIAYGASSVSDEEIETAARLANAHDFIMALPDGYDTILGERGATLSGGQRQRIAIARAAVRRAPIIILDEPTTGLDRENERVVSEALERLTRGKTAFIIAHNLHTTEHADLILYLEAGRVVERGTHADLMRLNGKYAAMYALQAAQHSRESPYESQEDRHALAR